jgi:hypothetical protein
MQDTSLPVYNDSSSHKRSKRKYFVATTTEESIQQQTFSLHNRQTAIQESKFIHGEFNLDHETGEEK